MKVIGKKPGKPAEMIHIDNDLKALQDYVGGRIETLTFSDNACFICNEEGNLNGMPFNLKFHGMYFYGPILVVGTKDEDFTDCPVPGFVKDQLNKRSGMR